MSLISDFNNIADGNNIFDSFKNAFSGYLVSPLNAFGLGGFVFDVEGDAIHNLGTEITDHYTEGNVAVQDHIAVKPKEVTLKNYVGELVYRLDGDTNTLLQTLVQKLTVYSGYLPALAAGASQVKGILDGEQNDVSFSDAINGAVNIWSLVQNLNPPIPRQQQAYQFFKSLMEQKILVAIQTPFEYITNMAIKSISAHQGEDSKYISDFTIVLKEIRTVSSESIAFDFIANQSPINAAQTSDLVNGGKTQGSNADLSVLDGAFK